MIGVENHPKIKVDHPINDAILLHSALRVNIFKQKDFVGRILI